MPAVRRLEIGLLGARAGRQPALTLLSDGSAKADRRPRARSGVRARRCLAPPVGMIGNRPFGRSRAGRQPALTLLSDGSAKADRRPRVRSGVLEGRGAASPLQSAW